jgi:hypothetical protein
MVTDAPPSALTVPPVPVYPAVSRPGVPIGQADVEGFALLLAEMYRNRDPFEP